VSGAGVTAHFSAVVFIRCFGALLNPHIHFHCIVVDGVFDADPDGGVVFHVAGGLDASAISAVQSAVRGRLLRTAERRGLLPATMRR
jgi:hypothetical protein